MTFIIETLALCILNFIIQYYTNCGFLALLLIDVVLLSIVRRLDAR